MGRIASDNVSEQDYTKLSWISRRNKWNRTHKKMAQASKRKPLYYDEKGESDKNRERGIVKTEENEYHGKTVVIATGTRPRELGLPGEAKFNKGDKGVYYYVTHREKFIGNKVLVVGGGDTAVDAALDLVDLADEITIIHRRDRFRALDENVKKMEESKKINIMLNTEIEEIKGKDKVEEVVLVNNKTGEKKVLSVDKVVLAVGLKPNTEMFAELGIKTDDRGYIITDNMQRTNVEGVFAVGDIVKGAFRLLIVGAAHGAIASHKIYEYIRKPYWAGEDEK